MTGDTPDPTDPLVVVPEPYPPPEEVAAATADMPAAEAPPAMTGEVLRPDDKPV